MHAHSLPLDSLRRLQNIGGGKMIGRTCNKSATPPPRKRCSDCDCSPGVRVACVQKNARTHTAHSESLPHYESTGCEKENGIITEKQFCICLLSTLQCLHSFFSIFCLLPTVPSFPSDASKTSDERRLLLGFLLGAVHRARHAVLPS